MAQTSLRLQLFNKLLKWHVLMRICSQCYFSDTAKQVAECGLVLDSRTHDQRVDKESDQPFRFQAIASCYGHPYRYISFSTITGQQRLEGCQQSHKQRCAFALAQ